MRTAVAGFIALFFLSSLYAQNTPMPDEVSKWQKNPQPLETTSCKIITWLLDKEADQDTSLRKIHLALGWWGRGFVEGAAYTIDLPDQTKAMKKVTEFGLTVDVVTAHLAAYCRSNPGDTPIDGVQQLLLKALK